MEMTIRLLAALAPLLLAGCGAATKPQPVAPRAAVQAAAGQNYPEKVRLAVTRELRLPAELKSKSCSISIHLQPDGALKDIRVLKGDPQLCAVAGEAVKKAKMPKMANPTEYLLFNAVVLDFVP